ncbi:MAG: carboxynorspermidine decarboxylase [Spirochaetes bacterium]|nr:carboxynorspermidine decarboxylase [Spirochaetota bacterium]
MEREDLVKFDPSRVTTPAYIIFEESLEENLKKLHYIHKATGAKILLALKGFAMWNLAPLIMRYLQGTCASSLNEARLGKEEFGGEVHTFAAALGPEEAKSLTSVTDYISFNSFAQFELFAPEMKRAGISTGLRVNPEYSEAPVPLYDPCAEGSRLGIKAEIFEGKNLSRVEGLHFHTLCEQNAAPLVRTLETFEKKFAPWLSSMQWFNFGGGHHITRDGYDTELLINTLNDFSRRHTGDIFLEPGEAVALNAGVLVSTVLDIVHNTMDIAVLDVSAAAHMPDVLEMPYRPEVHGAGKPGEKSYTCRLAGVSCLAGDVIGDYSFDRPLKIGDRIVFLDMGHYTMVKTTTFNGISLPSIMAWKKSTDQLTMVRTFGYEDFKGRLS